MIASKGSTPGDEHLIRDQMAQDNSKTGGRL